MKKPKSKEEKRAIFQEKVAHGKMILGKIANKNVEKDKQPKRFVPKSIKYRIAAGVSWTVVVVIGLNMVVAVHNGSHNTTVEAKTPVIQYKVNSATSQAAVQFAKDFTAAYFAWAPGAGPKQTREDQLSKYLARGLDPDGGLSADDIKTTSTFKGAELKNVEEVGKNSAKITLLVTYEVTEAPAQGTNNTPPPPQPKQVTKAIIVPVAYDGKTYGVYELPTFTKLKDKTTLKVAVNKHMTKVQDAPSVQNITNFLGTFFESYAQDGTDKLSYILVDTEHKTGLQGSMKFVKVEESNVYQGKSKNQFIVTCTVAFADPDSGSQFSTNYQLEVEQQVDHYVVTKIN